MDGSSDLLNVLEPLLEEVLFGGLTGFLSCLRCCGPDFGHSPRRFLSLSLNLTVTINPVSEGDSYVLDLTADVREGLPKVVPNTTILNSIPGINKGILQFDEFLLEPLNLLRNLKFISKFVEFFPELSNDRLRRGHVTEIKALEVLRQRGFTRSQLGLKLITNCLTKLMELVLCLVDSAMNRIHSRRELLTDN